MTSSQKFTILSVLVGIGAGLYFVTGGGDPGQATMVCGLPSIGPAAFYSALGIPQPTLADGTGSGDCLPPYQAEQLYRRARIVAQILPKWRAAGLKSTQCAAGLLAVEFGDPDAGEPDRSEQLVRVCGPAPAAAATKAIEELRQLPGTSVRLLATFGPFPNASYPVLSRWMQGNFPPAIRTLYPCACRMTSDTAGSCQVGDGDGGYAPAPFGVTLSAGTWTGGCATKTCVEAAEVAERQGLGYSMPPECQ